VVVMMNYTQKIAVDLILNGVNIIHICTLFSSLDEFEVDTTPTRHLNVKCRINT